MLTIHPTQVGNGHDAAGKKVIETWWSARYAPGSDHPSTEVVTSCPLRSAMFALHYARNLPEYVH